MKKITTILALAFFILTACQPLEPSFTPSADDAEYLISGTIVPAQSDTRVTYDIGPSRVTPSWSVGDEIFGVDSAGDAFTFICTEVDSTGRAKFIIKPNSTYTVVNNRELYAVYFPGHGESEICENDEGEKVLNVNIWSQTGRLDDSLPAIMTATGTVSDNIVEFNFENQLFIAEIRAADNIIEDQQDPLGTHQYDGITINRLHIPYLLTSGQIKLDSSMSLIPNYSSYIGVSIEGNWTVSDNRINFNDQAGNPLVFASMPFTLYNIYWDEFILRIQAYSDSLAFETVNDTFLSDFSKNNYYIADYSWRFHKDSQKYNYVQINDGISTANVPFEWALNTANHNNGDITISLLEDFTFSKSNIILDGNDGSGEITLDLNGHKLTLDSCYFSVRNGRKFKVTDLNATDKGWLGGNNKSNYTIYASGGSTITVEGAYIFNAKDDGYAIYLANGSATINRSAIRSTLIVSNYIGIGVNTNSTLTVEEAEIRGAARCVYNWGTTVIKGGEFHTVNNSTVISQGSSSNASILGGRFGSSSATTELFTIISGGNTTVSGGYFDRPVTFSRTTSAYCNTLSGDSVYPFEVVSGSAPLVTVKGTTTYNHLNIGSAQKHAEISRNDLTIRLTDNHSYNGHLDLTNGHDKKLTLDLNGKTLSTTSDSFISTSGTLVVTDSTRTTGAITSSNSRIFDLSSSGASLTVEGCSVACTLAAASSFTETMVNMASSGGTLTIRDARIYSTGKVSVLRAYEGTVNIYSSELTSGLNSEGWYVLNAANLSTVNVHSGSFYTSGTDNASTCHISNAGAHLNVIADGDTYFYSNGRAVSSGNKSYYQNLKLYGGYFNKMPSVPSSGSGSDEPSYDTGMSMQAVSPAVTHTHQTSGVSLEYGYRVWDW